MRASKDGIFRLLLVVLFVVAFYLVSVTDIAGSGMAGGDTERYGQLARMGKWSDWHGILLLLELCPMRECVEFATNRLWGSTTDHAISVLVLWQALSSLAICISFLLWVHRLCKVDKLYILVLPIFALSFILIDYFAYWNFKMYVDYNHMAWVALGFTALLYLKSPRKKVRLGAWLLFIVAMVHIAFLRRNGAVLLPFFAFFAITDFKPSYSLLRRGVYACIVCAVFYVGVDMAFNCIPFKRTHAEDVMKREDLRMAALLENRLDEYPVHTCFCQEEEPTRHWSLGQSDHPLRFMPDHDELACHYREQWRTRTGTMLAARGIEIVNFYTNARALDCIRPLVEHYYPKVKENPMAWEYPDYENYGKAGRHGWERLVIYGIAIGVLALLTLRRGRKMLGSMEAGADSALVQAYRILAIGMAYVGCFILCTPSLDNRFHCMAIIWSFYAFSLLICYGLVRCLESRHGGS